MSISKEEFLKQYAKEVHKPYKKRFKRAKVISKGINDIWASDLVDMQEWKEQNDGYRFMLVVVDVFSRYAWVKPLKDKTGTKVKDMFDEIIGEVEDVPNRLWVDQGKEYFNKTFQNYLEKLGTVMYSTFSEHKASIAERFNRTLKTEMWKQFTTKQTRRWVDMLPRLLKWYNNRRHSSLFGYTPKEAFNMSKKDEKELWILQYGDYLANEKTPKPNFKIGDHVRISRMKGLFEKGYLPNWSSEIFTVTTVIHSDPTRYQLKDVTGEPLKGSFYEQELQKTKHGDIWLVDEVKKTRKRKGKTEYFVSWLGMNSKYDRWIDADAILEEN